MKRAVIGIVMIGFVGGGALTRGQEAAPAASRPAQQQSAIVGVWTLNKDLSDTGERVKEAMGGGRPGGGGGGGMGGMGGGGGRGGIGGVGGRGGGMGGGYGGGNRGESGDRAREAAPVIQALQAPKGLTIVPEDGSVAITTSDGVSRRYVTDGKKAELLTGDGVVKYTAKWNGATLSIDTELDKGPKIAWTFVPMDIGAQLLVIVKIAGSEMPRDLVAHQIYKREKM